MSGYEAKVYLAMVSAGRPLRGYEIAKRSGVPRSTVYETIGKLVTRGAAFEVRSDSEATDYLALPAEAFLSRLRRDFSESVEALAEALPRVTERAEHVVHNIEGRQSVLARARDLIDDARDTLYVSIWGEELAELAKALDQAEKRGVDVSVVRFGESSTTVGHTYAHMFSAPDVVLDRVGCRLLAVAADSESVLIGGAVDAPMWGMFSNDPAVVLVAVEFIRHDIAMQVLVERLGLEETELLFRTDRTLLRLATGHHAPRLELHAGRTPSTGALPTRAIAAEKSRQG
jgi:HTH-type transcriptional regulator, sugar sensing transcriptional regulator